jgi:pimeloyl-ACP methyl ester carboxylesterase
MLFFHALLLVAFPAAAQELVTLQTRPGVTQSFFIASMDGTPAQAAALLFVGGGGDIRLRVEDGEVKFSTLNFLPRSRAEFVRNGILPVLVDTPSDQKAGEGMNPAFRQSAAHVRDVRAVVAQVRQNYPELPVFIVGTSASTVSAAHLAIALESEIAGVVLSASVFYWHGRTRMPMPMLVAFDWSKIKVPLLFVHHEQDGCDDTPYREAARLGRRFPLITVRGGKPPESRPCAGLSQHGYFGKEAETVDAIAGWMLGKAFAKDIQ